MDREEAFDVVVFLDFFDTAGFAAAADVLARLTTRDELRGRDFLTPADLWRTVPERLYEGGETATNGLERSP